MPEKTSGSSETLGIEQNPALGLVRTAKMGGGVWAGVSFALGSFSLALAEAPEGPFGVLRGSDIIVLSWIGYGTALLGVYVSVGGLAILRQRTPSNSWFRRWGWRSLLTLDALAALWAAALLQMSVRGTTSLRGTITLVAVVLGAAWLGSVVFRRRVDGEPTKEFLVGAGLAMTPSLLWFPLLDWPPSLPFFFGMGPFGIHLLLYSDILLISLPEEATKRSTPGSKEADFEVLDASSR
jgi:hypothetical protein